MGALDILVIVLAIAFVAALVWFISWLMRRK